MIYHVYTEINCISPDTIFHLHFQHQNDNWNLIIIVNPAIRSILNHHKSPLARYKLVDPTPKSLQSAATPNYYTEKFHTSHRIVNARGKTRESRWRNKRSGAHPWVDVLKFVNSGERIYNGYLHRTAAPRLRHRARADERGARFAADVNKLNVSERFQGRRWSKIAENRISFIARRELSFLLQRRSSARPICSI